ncbi:oligopeptide ABC transporter substrate-binding protein [Pseudoleptotrichia goodfellowii]|uniref:ABC transporter, substrate-binding protein, family 5 n=2 Tax=Pseudoleptotrichia goodfellowii TaxID=157692 RepID=D0GPJ1_9FUSO|nr:oligopeptide ABC transporter substrate-binding protein [Pseudoleptotrichia goodfellowii]EEY33990.1 ABC transporter, substrate-binding protein, family 5 [Pseudoleptotrichia goodfellowii F0264]MBF4806089.1 oligopeptide ABC transporter substrate-binding protein [Pseudoleptotrichia goodfellowii]BBM36448.1 family 5 extracellular solute-binding protein [Pseudoleptotrichia goodfellowii]
MRKIGTVMTLFILMLLISCGPGKKRSNAGDEAVDASKFPIETSNKDAAVKDAVLKVAIVKDSPLVGVFYEELYSDGFDGKIAETFFNNQIFEVDENFEVTDTGMATLSVDAANKKATIKIKDGIKWSDGQPLTADDVIYSYEVVGNKDYTGIRYNDDSTKIVGMKEYHEGKAPNISGLKKIDDKTVEVSFTELGQGVYTLGNGLRGTALPKHHLKDVPIKDLEKSELIRSKVVTLGAYSISNSVQGESLELKANENYFKGKPKIEKAVVQVVNSNTISQALKSGEYDMALRIPTDQYKVYKDYDNLEVLGRQELYYSYMGFKVGHYDKEKGENIPDPNAKMADVRLRQALAYGLDVDQMVKAFYNGLRERATSSVPPIFKKYFSKDIKGFPYDPEKAKKLLDEAGYKDVNGDGYREDKDGKPFEVRIASMAGGDIAEPLVQFYIQQWKEIGIKGVLSTGRLIEFNSFYEKVKADDPEIDVFFAAWTVGTNLNPIEGSGRKSMFNYPRFASDENDKLMAETASSKTLEDPNYKAEAYKKWQEYFIPQAVEVPLTYRYEMVPVNKRLKNFYIGFDEATKGEGIHKWELTAKEPIKASK